MRKYKKGDRVIYEGIVDRYSTYNQKMIVTTDGSCVYVAETVKTERLRMFVSRWKVNELVQAVKLEAVGEAHKIKLTNHSNLAHVKLEKEAELQNMKNECESKLIKFKAEYESKVKDLETKHCQTLAISEKNHSTELSEFKSKTAGDYYEKLKVDYIELQTHGDKNHKLTHDLVLKMMEKSPPATMRYENVSLPAPK